VISVIVCSKQPASWGFHQRNVQKTVGCEHEYIRIDNSGGRRGICAAYNDGVARAHGDSAVFVHEDAFFMEPGWGAALGNKFASDASIGLIGVAGTQYLFADDLRWHIAGRPFIRGRVVHEGKNGGLFVMTVMSWDKADAEVVAADGLFLAVRRDLFSRIRFDDRTFPGFHFYDLDICMQIRETHRCIVTWDILIKHYSAGKNDEGWHASALAFQEKYRDRLPASTASGIPGPLEQRVGATNYELKGAVPQATIY
jgi:GT2 family glycosyltransferase